MPSASTHSSLPLVEPGAGTLVAARGTALKIVFDRDESPTVQRAVHALADDLRTLVGAVPTAEAGSRAHSRTDGIIVGTIGVSVAVDAAIAAGALDVASLRDEVGALRWEGFVIAVVDGVLFLAGTDRRGTVYAVYEFARAVGVSPWQWWADIPVRHRDEVTLADDTHVVDWPAVRYRGVFINDEEELYHWARRHTADGTIGPQTYERLYELLLRLGANYLWPAMHIGAFNDDPENGRLAHEMGIVIGSSHCDILLRSNNHEFHPWSQAQPHPVRYDYSLTGSNREGLRDYWRGSVRQNRDYEVTWTVGIRGVHDSGFETAEIDADDSLDDDAKFRAKVALLEAAIHDQRGILSDALGVSPDSPPQLFIPYKEVLPLYDAGLQIPEDITLVWANDNFGHIRRFPSDGERTRSGGHGLYYHSSYWSNFTTSYLATSSTPLTLMRSELTKAWEGGIRTLWVDNVGGLKPLEIETEFFLRSAWQAGRESTTADVRSFVAGWVDAAFTGGIGERAADIYARYYQLNNQRKYEHLTPDVFPQVGFGDEAGRRLAALRGLFDETNALLMGLPEAERDAFFQVFAIKIHMSYLVNGEFVHADRSTLAHGQGKLAAADAHVATARMFGDWRRQLIHFYNTVMSGGRWNGMFTPDAFPPPVMPLHAPGTPAVRIAGSGLGVATWGATSPKSPRLAFDPYGRDEKWLEIFATGRPGVRYTVECSPWIEVSSNAGVVETESRVAVRLRDEATALAGRTGSIRVTSPDTGDTVDVTVTVGAAPRIDDGFQGWIEADGVVSIDPARPLAMRASADSSWHVVPDLGRYGNGALQAQPAAASPCRPRDAATAVFPFHLTTPGSHVLELHRLPTLDSTGRIRVGVSIDGADDLVIESATTDEHRGGWAAGVQDNVERLRVVLPSLATGAHEIALHAMDPWFTVSKIVISTSASVPTNLGPEFSAHTEYGAAFTADPDPMALDTPALSALLDDLYRNRRCDAGIADQLYLDRDFWTGDTTNRTALAVPQNRADQNPSPSEAGKDLIRGRGRGPAVEQAGVIAFEAEDALAMTDHAWRSADAGGFFDWVQTQAETEARAGLAMQVQPRGLRWHDPADAPGMHFTIEATTGGVYRVWLLLSFQDDRDDSCVVALDGAIQPIDDQFSRGSLCTYGSRQSWVWAHLSDLEIAPGTHTFSIHARESGLRIDRVYLTTGDELPPVDAEWVPSPRTARSAPPATIVA